MKVLAIHVVWTTYMTWPPGDARGHWSPLFELHGQVADRGGKLQPPDETTLTVARQNAKESPKVLSDEEVQIVAETIGNLVRHPGDNIGSKPAVFAAAIEQTHLHLLLGPVDEEISKCVGRIKGMSSSAILKTCDEMRKRVWTAGFWKVFIYDLPRVVTVKQYIDAHNVRRGLPANPYPWITPLDT